MRVAIVHYWLVGMRGGEKVLEALCETFPDADIFTHVYVPSKISDTIKAHRIRTTFIAKLPMASRLYQKYLPLMPMALEQLDLSAYDLVISSESGPAKGVITRPDALHVCYCHTPMRYLWNSYHAYKSAANPATRLLMLTLMHRLRLWDLASAARVDYFIANSENVASRIRKYYRRSAKVIYPPVDTQQIQATRDEPGDFYLHVGQLVRYKRTEIAIAAFNRMKKRLVVIGQGEEFRNLKKIAGPTVEMIGWQDGESLSAYYARCRALIFVADEDFGIVPVEAMSAGRPVIALRQGGALETVIPGETGIFFEEQTVEALSEAVARFELLEHTFEKKRIAMRAKAFSKAVFKDRIVEAIDGWFDARPSARAPLEPRMLRVS
ncbi:MAG TPA: glycosyltransferase [Stellaceae bacterium]|nr:glycosyltransferase [Stellaceae bacterium]